MGKLFDVWIVWIYFMMTTSYCQNRSSNTTNTSIAKSFNTNCIFFSTL